MRENIPKKSNPDVSGDIIATQNSENENKILDKLREHEYFKAFPDRLLKEAASMSRLRDALCDIPDFRSTRREKDVFPEDSFKCIFREILGDQTVHLTGENNPHTYLDLFFDILVYCLRNQEDEFLAEIKKLQTGIDVEKSSIEFAKWLKTSRVAEGVRIGEWGGNITKYLFEPLGAEVVTVSPFNPPTAGRIKLPENQKEREIAMAEYGSEELLFRAIRDQDPDPARILTKKDASTVFKGEFDIICSNGVLEPGSGFDQIAAKGGVGIYDAFLIEHRLVKDGGMIANGLHVKGYGGVHGRYTVPTHGSESRRQADGVTLNPLYKRAFIGKAALGDKAAFDAYLEKSDKHIFDPGQLIAAKNA